MVGSASGKTHRLGDRVTVRLVEAAPVAGALRFELLSDARPQTGPRRPARPAGGPIAATPSTAARRKRRAPDGAKGQEHDRRSDDDEFAPRDAWAAVHARLSRPLPELRQGPAVSRLPQGGRPLPGVPRGTASPSRRRRAGLFRDPDRRPHRGAARACGRDRIRAALLAARRALDAADARPVAGSAAAGQGRDRRAAMGLPDARLRSSASDTTIISRCRDRAP